MIHVNVQRVNGVVRDLICGWEEGRHRAEGYYHHVPWGFIIIQSSDALAVSRLLWL